MHKTIDFPNIGIHLESVGDHITVFGFDIAYYGIIIGIGILVGLLIAVAEAKRTGQKEEDYYDLAIYAVIFAIIGARAYYVIFSWDMYKDDLLSIFNTRNGGMAIYGSVIAAFITLAVFCKKKNMKYLTMADICVPGLALGQAIGRWGNFCNREAFGEYTDGLFAMRLPIEAVRQGEITEKIAEHIGEGVNYIQVHPTFLYESIWNALLVVLLIFLWRYKKFEGQITLAYLGGYGLGRFWIERLRTDQLHIPGTEIPVSQMLAFVLFVFSLVITIYMLKKNNKEKS